MTTNASAGNQEPAAPEAADGEAAPASDDAAVRLESLTVPELEDLERRAVERDLYLEHLQRKQAEMENLLKRHERERTDRARYASQQLVSDILPVLDNLHQAVDGLAQGGSAEQALEGMRLILDQFQKVLADSGVERIEALGQRFDPNFHEALMQEETDEVDDLTVLQELVRGYRMHDRVLRPTRVKVSRRPGPVSKPEASPEE